MTDLPRHWTRANIVELLELNSNGKPFQQGWSPRCEAFPASNGEWGVLKTTAIQEGEFWDHENKALPDHLSPRPHLEVKQGDLLITCAGPRSRCGVICLVDQTRSKLMMSGKMYRFRPQPDVLSPQYLAYFIQTQEAQLAIDRMKTGISDSGLNLTHGRFATLQVAVAPIKEQHRIVTKLDELFSHLDQAASSLKAAQEQLASYRQALFKHAFEGRLTVEWRGPFGGPVEDVDALLARISKLRELREQEELAAWKKAVEEWEHRGARGPRPSKPSRFKPLEPLDQDEVGALPKLPERWRYVRLGEIAQIGSGMSVSSRRKVDDPVEVPYLRVANVQRGHLVLDEIKTMTIERSHLSRLQLTRWDVLFNEGGDRDKLGRGWIWDCQVEPCITQNHVFRASPILSSQLHSKWISYWGNSFGQRYFDREGKQTTNLASINKTVLGRFPVPVPPAQEQEAIVQLLEEKMTVVDHLDAEIGMALAQLGALRKTILKRAFDGRLVVHDPADETAGLLLERIRGEQDAQSGGKKKREAAS